MIVVLSNFKLIPESMAEVADINNSWLPFIDILSEHWGNKLFKQFAKWFLLRCPFYVGILLVDEELVEANAMKEYLENTLNRIVASTVNHWSYSRGGPKIFYLVFLGFWDVSF